jgi:hypothetical protein
MKTNNNKHSNPQGKHTENRKLDEWFANLSPGEVKLARCLWRTLLEAEVERVAVVSKGRSRVRARLVYLLDRLGPAPEWQRN